MDMVIMVMIMTTMVGKKILGKQKGRDLSCPFLIYPVSPSVIEVG